MALPSIADVNEYILQTGDTLAQMRLLIEGASIIYEDGASSLLRLAYDNDQPAAAMAFDTIGTALYHLREHTIRLQMAFAESIRQEPENAPAP